LLALEISRHITPEKALATYPALRKYELIQDGDVHQLDDFLGTTVFMLESPTLMELRMAFRHMDGRDVWIGTKK
jgi:3',5'-nucleoside bisphosphate phosphatase